MIDKGSPDKITLMQGTILALTATAVLLIFILGTEPEVDSREGIVYIPSSVGNVVFDHAGHIKDADLCIDCHHEADSGVEDIQSCRNCHPAIQNSNELIIDCKDCHDFTKEEVGLGHYDLTELHGDCDLCHYPRNVATAYHTKCTNCHIAVDEEKFRDKDNLVRCGWCHLP